MRAGEKNATWSINNDGIALHLNGKDDLGLIQRAARKIDGMGIKHVALSGEGWNTDRAWAFWAGYKGPKGQRQVEWPTLDDAQRSELDNRLTIIDWVRDTINAPAEELGPEQLAQRAVDLLCGVAGEKVSYRITKGEDLREQNYLGLHTVGRGSERPPVLLALARFGQGLGLGGEWGGAALLATENAPARSARCMVLSRSLAHRLASSSPTGRSCCSPGC